MQEMDIVYIQSNSTMSEEEKTEIIDEIQTKYRHYAIMYDEVCSPVACCDLSS